MADDTQTLLAAILEQLQALNHAVREQQSAAAQGPLDLEAAATYLGIRPYTLRDYVKEGAIAYSQAKPGARLFFRREDLDAFLEQNRIPTNSETRRRTQSKL